MLVPIDGKVTLPATDAQSDALFKLNAIPINELEMPEMSPIDKVLTNILDVTVKIEKSERTRVSLDVQGEHPDGCDFPVIVKQGPSGKQHHGRGVSRSASRCILPDDTQALSGYDPVGGRLRARRIHHQCQYLHASAEDLRESQMRRFRTALCAVFLLGSLYASLAQAPSQSIAVTVYNQGTALVREQRRLALEEGINRIDLRDVAATIDPTSVSLRSLSNPDGTVVLEQNYSYDLVNSSALLSRYLDETIKITAADGTLYSGELLSGRNSEAILRTDSGEIVVVRLHEARDIRFPALPEALITRPTLQWLLSSASAGEQDIELTYLAGGMNWSADYNLLLTSDQTSFDLKGWVTLNNHSGRASQRRGCGWWPAISVAFSRKR